MYLDLMIGLIVVAWWLVKRLKVGRRAEEDAG